MGTFYHDDYLSWGQGIGSLVDSEVKTNSSVDQGSQQIGNHHYDDPSRQKQDLCQSKWWSVNLFNHHFIPSSLCTVGEIIYCSTQGGFSPQVTMLRWTCTAHFGKMIKIQQLINSRSPFHFQSSKSSKIYQQQDHQSGVTIQMASHPSVAKSTTSRITTLGLPFQS